MSVLIIVLPDDPRCARILAVLLNEAIAAKVDYMLAEKNHRQANLAMMQTPPSSNEAQLASLDAAEAAGKKNRLRELIDGLETAASAIRLGLPVSVGPQIAALFLSKLEAEKIEKP
jgi:hypothetical protein